MNKKLYAKAKLFTGLLITLSVFGLLFVPMFPWITTTNEGTTNYASEAMIQSWATSYIESLSDFNAGLYINQEQVSSAFGSLSPISGLSQSISLISLSFWCVVLISILIFIGLALYKLGKRFELISYVVLLLGSISALIISVLILIFHLQFILNLGSLSTSDSMSFLLLDLPSFEFSSAYFGYNYIPFLLGIFLLVVSIFYTKLVFSPSLAFIKNRKKIIHPAKTSLAK